MARFRDTLPPRTPQDDAPPVGGLHIAPARREQRQAALGVLLTGAPDGSTYAVDQFTQFARTQNLALDHLWVGEREGQLLAAALLVPCAGRTAMAFISPPPRRGKPQVVSAVLRQACLQQSPHDVRMIQALIDAGQTTQEQVLQQAGFRALAYLVYMQRPTDLPAQPLSLDEPLRVVPWSSDARGAFARAILASYEDTRDCPALLGLRDIDDIIDGHMATGQFQPNLWLALFAGDEPAGVMLLNQAPPRHALELVYLGLAKSWRGRGLGRRLLRYALGQAPRYDATSMLLAVDDHNEPALRLYQGMQFTANARKLAMIFTLS